MEAKYLRTKMIEELYIGILFLGSILAFIFSEYISINLLATRIFIFIFTTYLLVYSINFIYKVYFKDDIHHVDPNFILFFIDGIFLTIFLYLTRDLLDVLELLFIIYIIFQSIRFYDKSKVIFSLYTTICYMSLLVIENPKSLISIKFFLTVIFFFVIVHVLSTIFLETSRLEDYVKHMFRELQEKNTILENMVSKDYLTNMYNHRSFYSFLKDIINSSKQKQLPFCLSILDLDNFKYVNDTYGHLAGDHVLKEVSDIITDNLREGDIAARYGGEEFAIIFPNTNINTANAICEKIRNAIEDNQFNFDENNIKITISGGLGEAIIYDDEIEKYNFINFVDELLYDAKANGKNQIKLAESIVAIN